jgi:hypothetical protein
MPSSIIRTPATPNLLYSEKTRQLSKSRPKRVGGKGLIASTVPTSIVTNLVYIFPIQLQVLVFRRSNFVPH